MEQAQIEYTRFEVELEFVQCLANPFYLNYLAVSKFFEDKRFIRYLEYLEYFRKPEYTKFLTYPAHSLNNLSLLKQPSFREQIIAIDFAKFMFDEAVGNTPAVPPAEGEGANGTAEFKPDVKPEVQQ